MAIVDMRKYWKEKKEKVRKLTIGSFRRRFTFDERVAIEESTVSAVKVLDKDLMTSSFVDLDFPEVIAGMQLLVDVGILTEERKAEMLVDGQPSEKYNGVE